MATDGQLYALLLPGLKVQVRHWLAWGWRFAEGDDMNAAEIWMEDWIPHHRLDFKQTFTPALKAWCAAHMRPPKEEP